MNDDDGGHSQTTARAVASTALALYQRVAPLGGSLAHNGAIEWTCLACVCLVINHALDHDTAQQPQIVPIALGTGTKTLPYADIAVGQGDIVHDSHAEVLARRAARRWLAERILVEVQQPDEQEVEDLPRLFDKNPATESVAPFKLKDDVRVWCYISTLPCGQCSMPYTLRKQYHTSQRPSDDITAASASATTSARSVPPSAVTRGRFNIGSDDTGASKPMLRTVPGRADAPPSLSHSCSDKLLLWSTIGWQGSILSDYLEPVRIDRLVISSDSSYEVASQQQVQEEVRHGLDIFQRLQTSQIQAGTSSPAISDLAHAMLLTPSDLAPPLIHITDQTFSQSQDRTCERALQQGIPIMDLHEKVSPAWGSTNWIRPSPIATELLRLESQSERAASRSTRPRQAAKKETESLVNGIRRGAPLKRLKAYEGSQTTTLPLSEKTRSRLCKLEWFRFMLTFHAVLTRNDPHSTTYAMADGGATYAKVKGKCEVEDRTTAESSAFPVKGRDLYRLRKRILRGPDLPDAGQREVVQTWLDSVRHRSNVEQPPESDVLLPSSHASRFHEPVPGLSPPLKGWLTTPASLESFDCQGLHLEQ